MDFTPVNWEALDSLVIDFAKSENLVEDPPSYSPAPPQSPSTPSSSSSSSSSSYRSRLLIRQIRWSLEAGDVDAAIDLLCQHAPAVLEDHRLLFRLQKQKFIELLRKGTARGRDSAIECLRAALAPCALNAYPEAYEEFKHVLLALIYDKEDENSPVADEWSERRRLDIAGLLSSVLRAHLNAYDPIFSMTLRYLISIHKVFCFRQGITSPISDLTERLLFEDRDPPGIPQEMLYEAPPFDEVDIQALAHAVELTRQGAVDSLRFAKGNLYQAFQNELCRMKLNVAMLDELVHEYCIYRGLVDGHTSSSEVQITSNCSRSCQLDPALSPSRDCSSLNIDSGTGRLSDSETSVNNVINMECAHSMNAASVQGNEVESRFSPEATSNNEDCSSSNMSRSISNCRRCRKIKSHGTGQRSGHKRWKGRMEMVEITYVPLIENEKERMPTTLNANGATEEQASLNHSSVEQVHEKEHKYEIILELRDLASRGMAAEVVEEIYAMDPNFFVQNPTLLFQLKQVEFLKHVSDGDHGKALRVACSYLGPLAAKNSDLLKPLKETLFTLLKPNENVTAKSIPLPALATSLQVALGGRLGIEEPQLIKIMRATLHSHNEWFRLQMCRDRFEGLLKIDCLKDIDATLVGDSTSRTYMENCTRGSQFSVSSSNRLPEGGSSPASVSSGDVICNENAILKVMEFLALPRADAIHLLVQYNGNAETVIQQIFA